MPDATHFARSPEALGRIGTPAPPGPCAYPGGCEKEHVPGMVTCLAHSIAYRQWRQKRNSDKRRKAATPDEQPAQVQCAREGCPHSFTPKTDQIYHSRACERIVATLAQRERDAELARVRKQNREQRRAEARAAGIREEDVLAQKIDRYWERVKDPTYYEGIRHRNYSTLVETGAVTRAQAKSASTRRAE